MNSTVTRPREEPRPVELCSWCNEPATVVLHYTTGLRLAACGLDGVHPRVLSDEQAGDLVRTEPVGPAGRAHAPRRYLGRAADQVEVWGMERR